MWLRRSCWRHLVLLVPLVPACVIVPPEAQGPKEDGEADNGEAEAEADSEVEGSPENGDEESDGSTTSDETSQESPEESESEATATSVSSSSEDEDDEEGETSDTEPEEPRGPTPPKDGANFPFPQNRETAFCKGPSQYRNSDVLAAYEKWRADTVTSDGAGGHMRIKRTPSDTTLEPASTVSEGIAYGMLIAVYMNDQALFDALWRYEQMYLTEHGLMHWYISATGEVLGSGAASDADEDMAWALLMADKQWGGGGSLDASYLDIAKETIQKVWDHEVIDGRMLLPGDGWGGWSDANPSYFAPSYYRTFAEVSGNAGWLDVVTTSYDVIEKSLNETNGNHENGLVPAWCTSEGEPNAGVWQGSTAPTHYQYDSCRTPFRIGLDYCFHGESRARDYVAKTSGFFSTIGVPNIVDGYDLNGAPRPQYPDGQSAAFIGPAGVGAMYDATHAGFVQDAYDAVSGLDLLTGGAYYEESWTVLSLLVMTGNFLDYTQIEPASP